MTNTPKIWTDTITLPTYQAGQPNKNPLFLEKRVYQGSSGKIYPLAFTDHISDKPIMKSYQVVYLENDYLKIMVMPEMGGKIYRAIDKTNNYDFVYYNHVVKPALVGLTGPWVSGGIEFNWPQHHRPSTFSPVSYQLQDNDDGSVTCWISEIDRMYGTKGKAGFTLYGDKAYLEIKGQLYNRTDIPQTFLWWANPAVAVNDYTKSIFPPDVHAVFDHGKRDVSKFPIATGTYYKMDYSKGVDISRYKNIPVPTSYMAYHSDYNFVGGYDFSKEAGILHIANHHISPGKKQWTWGNGDFGRAWDRNLTDQDGPYIELMTGVYTDNQPDFTWLSPKEGKTFRQYFMPYKGVGEVKNASLEAIINLDLLDATIELSLYTPVCHKKIQLVLTLNKKVIYRQTLEEVSPDNHYKKVLAKPENTNDHDYQLLVLDENGDELIAYQADEPKMLETPDPATAPEAPEAMASQEDLFLTGQHIEQYRHATFLAEDYYLEGLKRDPNDSRCNNAYGLLMYRRGRFDLAEGYFTQALKSLTKRNPNPYDSEPFYNLGLSLKMQGRLDEAYSAFYKATWHSNWQNSGYYQIATIDCLKGNLNLALEHIDQALVRNTYDIKSRGLRIALLRHLDQPRSAREEGLETLRIDSTAFAALYELSLADRTYHKALVTLLRDDPHNYLELASDYMSAGLYADALKILGLLTKDQPSLSVYPMVHYFIGYCHHMICEPSLGDASYTLGESGLSDYCFPHRLIELQVLKHVVSKMSQASKANYYLGNLYYDKKQYDLAMDFWHESLRLNDQFPTVQRNLALAYVNKKEDALKGLNYLESAFKLDPTDGRVLFELDQLYRKLNRPHQERLDFLKAHKDLVSSRDDLYVEYLALLNNMGAYDDVSDALARRLFHPWEGGEGKVVAQYKRCRLERSKQFIEEQKYSDAILLLKECQCYPDNLGEGKLANAAENDINYYLGLSYEALGEKEKAKAHYALASTGIGEPTDALFYNDQPADMMYYQGLAYGKLGMPDQALSTFNRMFDYGEKNRNKKVTMDYFAVSMPDFLVFDVDLSLKNHLHCNYLMALGLLGKGDIRTAIQLLTDSLKEDANHQGMLFLLKELV